jgi:putative ABC transport system substrate-binding protein
MKKTIRALGLYAMLFALCFPAQAQQPMKIPRIGFLNATSRSDISARIDAFRRGLSELGYVEGKNIFIEYRHAERKFERLPELASELVRLKVDLMVTVGPPDTRAAKEVTTTIPIVMAQDSDPVGNAFVASLARPGGNITGLSNFAADLAGKRLELLKEILPRLSRVGLIGTSSHLGTAQAVKDAELAAGTLGLKLQFVDVLVPQDIERAFQAASKRRIEAVLVLTGPLLLSHRTQLIEQAAKNRMPAIYALSEYAEAGGLMVYGTNIPDLFHRAATYVDKILKGAKPADLPVEQPKKFEFVINLKAAKQIGLTIPPNVLARADRVIR